MKSDCVERWKEAQTHEKDYQLRKKVKPGKGKRIWAYKYIKLLESYTIINENSKILDIGCGFNAMVSPMVKGERIGLDPLTDIYFKEFDLPKNISWLKGLGEHIPIKNGCLDVVLCMNVLDHMRDPTKAFSEIRRVLRSRGIAMVYVNCYSPFVKYYRENKEKLKIGDSFHPFSFSAKEILETMNSFNLHVAYVDKEPTKWLNSLLIRLEEKNIAILASTLIRAFLSLLWRLAHTRTALDDDGAFIFVAHKTD